MQDTINNTLCGDCKTIFKIVGAFIFGFYDYRVMGTVMPGFTLVKKTDDAIQVTNGAFIFPEDERSRVIQNICKINRVFILAG